MGVDEIQSLHVLLLSNGSVQHRTLKKQGQHRLTKFSSPPENTFLHNQLSSDIDTGPFLAMGRIWTHTGAPLLGGSPGGIKFFSQLALSV